MVEGVGGTGLEALVEGWLEPSGNPRAFQKHLKCLRALIGLFSGLLCLFYQSCCLYEHTAGTLQNMNYVREMLRTILTLLSEHLCGKWASDYGVCLSALDCLVALTEVEELDQHSRKYPSKMSPLGHFTTCFPFRRLSNFRTCAGIDLSIHRAATFETSTGA